MILELRKKLDSGQISPEKLFKESVEKAKKFQDKYNSFVTIVEQFEHKKSKSLISGIPYSLKDIFSTKGILTTASSNILKNYVPVYDATVYQKLKEAGAVLVGKTVLDELAMGGTGVTGHTGIVRNPLDEKRIIGGSSAGSAASVVLDIVPFSIGTDTGDSVRKPAAYGGIVGFKPTYGRISRYGLFAFASSLDHVGCFAKSVYDVAIVADVLKGYDPKDMTSLPDETINYVDKINDNIKGRKLFYIKEVCNPNSYSVVDDEMKQIFDNFQKVIEGCKKIGFEIEEISIPKSLLEAIYPSYMAISCAETTSNNANLTGIAFGNRKPGETVDQLMFNTRTEGFSELIKRRFILGSYILQRENQEKLFLNAGRIRRLIVNQITKLFEKYDGMIMPATGGVAPLIDAEADRLTDKHLILENHLIIGNFGGFPSITIPSGKIDNLPIAINLTGAVLKDCLVLNMAHQIEQSIKEDV